MILTRERVEEIVNSHKIDGEVPLALIQDLSQSHEELREYSIKITKFIESNINDFSHGVVEHFLNLVPDASHYSNAKEMR